MKKYLFSFALTLAFTLSFSLFSIGQNMVINGDMEAWAGGVPDSWTKAENITQESTNVHGGSFSAAHMSDESTKDLQQDIGGVEAGQEYTISYWFLDDDSEARTRIWSYWLSGTTTLPDNEDILRPSTYSEDNASWLHFNEVLTAPAGADGFRFEVRVYKQDGVWGGQVYYDDFELIGDNTVYPEPSNYPTNFMANAAGLSVNLAWTDATGSQLPSAYIIMAGLNPSLPVPVDGTPVPNDTDLSDGNGALNVNYGEEMAAFTNLESNTTYHFTIYSYTNTGANIDFKTDGSAPSASASTSNISIIESENFDVSWGNWTTISVVGAQEWDRDNTYGIGDTPCASMTGYEGQPFENDDWLISPALNLDDYENEVLVFYNALGYTGPDLELKISTDYDGGGDPGSASWTDETFTFSTGFFEWTESGNIDLSGYNGNAVYIAFHFTSTDAESATWEIDDILITGEEDAVVDPEPSNYPTNFDANVDGTSINLSWTDAIGTQLPGSYIIFAGTSASLPTPEDGIPVPNDTDLSDGSGALNVVYGMEEATFVDLVQGTTYYFSIYPYTNSGNNIDFKTDGTAPTTNELVPTTPEPTNYPTDFTASATSAEINLSWTDATGAQLPEAYIIFAGTTASLPTPDDGTPVANDTDLSDGSGALNVLFGMEEAMFAELGEGTYYFSIYSYTNNGANIDYKNDGTAPTADASIQINTEPTNYPTLFSAEATATTINLSWTDATGAQLPEAYIIFAGTSASLPSPTDGIPTPDDLDLTDGLGAANVDYGMGEFSFSGLQPSTTYYFSIYPYTNAGVNINYKNDGTVPIANATTTIVELVIIEEENFDISWGNWTTISVVGDQVWDRDNTYGINNTPCASMTGYEGQANENDDWLISPALNLDDYINEILVFQNALGYTGPDLQLKVSTDYDGGGDPYSGTWTTESFTMSTGYFEWTESGEIDLSGYDGSAVYVAFHFTSTNSESATWEVEDILIAGEGETTVNPEPTNYPITFAAEATGTSIFLSWTDATGEQLPDNYLIYASTDTSLPLPSDGTPVPDDTNLSDGSGAINVSYGSQDYTFGGLEITTTYYFSIYPYTNSGAAIDYKNDGTAPTADATTEEPVTVVIESENFDDSWGNWTTISLVGSQEWDRDNTYGIGDSPCASMTGYEGQAYENDDWLISPALDLDSYNNEILVFQNALGYTGPDLQLKISTDYDGGVDPNSATWSTESFTMSTGFFEWTESGEIDLSGYDGDAVYVAFHFTSTNSESATWEVDDIVITGEEKLSSDDQLFTDEQFNVYPNPTTGFIYIEKPGIDFTDIHIMTITGKIVKSVISSNDITKVDLSELHKGLYLITFNNKQTGQTITRKLILQ